MAVSTVHFHNSTKVSISQDDGKLLRKQADPLSCQNDKDLSEISRGWGWKTGEGHSFLSPSKGRAMKKNRQQNREGHTKLRHCDHKGML